MASPIRQHPDGSKRHEHAHQQRLVRHRVQHRAEWAAAAPVGRASRRRRPTRAAIANRPKASAVCCRSTSHTASGTAQSRPKVMILGRFTTSCVPRTLVTAPCAPVPSPPLSGPVIPGYYRIWNAPSQDPCHDRDPSPATASPIATPAESDYRDAGVDIAAAATRWWTASSRSPRATSPPAGVMGGLGGFGALFDLRAAGFCDPVLVSTTDGVGTKLKIAIDTGRHDTVGIDLVAMCVNDLVVQGAEPLFFLDYFATGALSVDQAAPRRRRHRHRLLPSAACALVGGETAEMPGLYAAGDYDLAGFSVGAAERDALLPGRRHARRRRTRPGQQWPCTATASPSCAASSRSVTWGWDAPAPWAPGETLGQALMQPTRIYVKPMLALHRAGRAAGGAHITGGGLPGNVPRMLPEGACATLDAGTWPLPPVFGWLARTGKVPADEMLRGVQLRHRHGAGRQRRRRRNGRADRAWRGGIPDRPHRVHRRCGGGTGGHPGRLAGVTPARVGRPDQRPRQQSRRAAGRGRRARLPRPNRTRAVQPPRCGRPGARGPTRRDGALCRPPPILARPCRARGCDPCGAGAQ